MKSNSHQRPADLLGTLLRFYYSLTLWVAVTLLAIHGVAGLTLRPGESLNFVLLAAEGGIALLALCCLSVERKRIGPTRTPKGLVFAAIGLLQVGVALATRGVFSPFILLAVTTSAFAGLTMLGAPRVYVSFLLAIAFVLGTRAFMEKGMYGLDVETVTALPADVGFILLAGALGARAGRSHRDRLATLEEQSRRDPLTSLENRRAFMERMESEMERAERFHWPITMLLLDLDHFKRLNDEHGHAVGDQVLIETAVLLRDTCGSLDLLARVGGEEFAIAATAAEPKHGTDLAERIVRAFRAWPWERVRPGMKVTVSVGVARLKALKSRGGAKSTLSALLESSDRALYEVKANGRDGWRVSEEPAHAVVA